MLLNEFLKQHKTVEELRATVTQRKKQIEAFRAGLQKVSTQLEGSKSAFIFAHARLVQADRFF